MWWFADTAAKFPEAWKSFKDTAFKIAEGLSRLGFTKEDIPDPRKLTEDTVIRLLALFRSAMERDKELFQHQLAELNVFQLAKLMIEAIGSILNCTDCTTDEKKLLFLGLINHLPPLPPLWQLPAVVVGVPAMDLGVAREFVFDLYVIHQMLQRGWRPLHIGSIKKRSKDGRIIEGIKVDFVATKNVKGIGLVRAFVQAYDRFAPRKITGDVNRIADYVAKHKDARAMDVIVIVINEPTDRSSIDGLRFRNRGVPVLIIYTDKRTGTTQVRCIECPPGVDPVKLAESMGYSVGKPPNPSSPNDSIITTPEPPKERSGGCRRCLLE